MNNLGNKSVILMKFHLLLSNAVQFSPDTANMHAIELGIAQCSEVTGRGEIQFLRRIY